MALTAGQLATATGMSDEDATRLLPVADFQVASIAGPETPAAVRDEAVIRTAGYLADQPAAAVRSIDQGEVSTEFAPSMVSPLRASGAMALLAPWRKHRLGGAE